MMGGRDSLVRWEDSYAIGLTEIDGQHKTLFDIMNHLWSAIVRRADAGEMAVILEELERYTISHFTAEETFMRVTGFTDFEAHKEQHRIFVEKITDARKASQSGQQTSLELLHFLKDWLVTHILVKDKAYAEQYKAAAKPKSFLGRFFSKLVRAD